MRCAFYIPRLTFGGAEKVVVELLREVVNARDLSATLITDLRMSPLAVEIPKGVSQIDLPDYTNVRHLAKLARLGFILRKEQFDVLLCNLTHANINAMMATTCIPKLQTRIVLVEHCVVSRHFKTAPSLKDRLIRLSIAWAYRRAHSVICVSEGVKEDLLTTFNIPNDLCTVIHNPINGARVRSLSEESLPTNVLQQAAGRKTVVTVGRLSREKNHLMLLQAFTQLCNIRPDFLLVVVGDGAERFRLEQYVQEFGLDKQVLFVGYQRNPYKYLRLADVVAHPCPTEGFGNVIVEAIALGKPVACVASVGSKEILGGTGCGTLCADSPESMSRAIVEASRMRLDDEEGSSRAQCFDPVHIYGRYVACLKRLPGLG